MAHGDAQEGKWRGNWRMEWVASTLHTTSEHGVSSFTTADAHTSAASIRLNWSPRPYKRTRPFRRKTKLVFALVPSHFKRSLPLSVPPVTCHTRLRYVHIVSGKSFFNELFTLTMSPLMKESERRANFRFSVKLKEQGDETCRSLIGAFQVDDVRTTTGVVSDVKSYCSCWKSWSFG